MLGRLATVHHSIADWDFQQGATARELDPSTFISSPTSLHFDSHPANLWNAILCRLPLTQCLPVGECRTWLRGNKNLIGPTPCSFRNQVALGSADIYSCYFLYMQYDTILLYSSVGEYWTHLYTWDFTRADFAWYHFRVCWYNGFTPAEVPALCVDLYREIDGEWIKMGDTAYDTLNRWKDSDVNRCGPLCFLRNGVESWFDDTEIWGPL